MPCLEANDSGSGWPVPLKSTDPDEQTFSVCVCVCVFYQYTISQFLHTQTLDLSIHFSASVSSAAPPPSALPFFLKKKHPILPHSTSLPLSPPNPPPACPFRHFPIFHSLRVNAHYILLSRFRPN